MAKHLKRNSLFFILLFGCATTSSVPSNRQSTHDTSSNMFGLTAFIEATPSFSLLDIRAGSTRQNTNSYNIERLFRHKSETNYDVNIVTSRNKPTVKLNSIKKKSVGSGKFKDRIFIITYTVSFSDWVKIIDSNNNTILKIPLNDIVTVTDSSHTDSPAAKVSAQKSILNKAWNLMYEKMEKSVSKEVLTCRKLRQLENVVANWIDSRSTPVAHKKDNVFVWNGYGASETGKKESKPLLYHQKNFEDRLKPIQLSGNL